LSEWAKALHTDKITAWKTLNSLEKKCVIKLKRLGKGKSISYMTNTHIYEWTCIDKELFAKWLTHVSQINNTSVSETANTVLTKSTIPLDTKSAIPKESIKEIIVNKTIKEKEKVPFSLPTWINEETWNDFLEMRQKMKAEPTEKAKVLLVKELGKFKSVGDDPNQVLCQSILNNWKGVFTLKEKGGGSYHGTNAAYKAQGQTSEPIKFIDGDAPAPID